MLRWSPGAVKATVGVGGLGLMACVMEVLARLSLPSPYPLVFLLAFAPMIVFMFTGDVDRPWARRAQWAAIAWYGVGALVSIGVLAAGGLARHDLFFIVFVAIGAWPCVVAARHLSGSTRKASEPPMPAIVLPLLPDERGLVLKGARGKSLRLLLMAIALVACSCVPSLQREHPVLAWSGVVFFGLGGAMAGLRLAFPSLAGTLMLDANGFTSSTFGRRHLTRWTDVRAFGLAHVHNARMIAISYAPDYQGQRLARGLASGLTGIEGGLPDVFEVSGADLVALLETWRVHFGSPARSVGAD